MELLEHDLFLEVGLTIKVHGVYEGYTVFRATTSHQEVTRKGFIFLHFDDVAHLDILPETGEEGLGVVFKHPGCFLVDFLVQLMSLIILLKKKVKKIPHGE